MKSLSQMIKKRLPYHYYQYLIITLLMILILLLGSIVGLSFVMGEPIPYDSQNVNDYMYVDVNEVYDASNDYYLASDDQYVYVYYDDSQEASTSLRQLTGVPKHMSDETLEKLLPAFQKNFPNLKVTTIAQVKEYVGLYSIDHSLPHMSFVMRIIGFITLIPFLLFIIVISKLIYYKKKISSSLFTIASYNEIEEVKNDLLKPLYVFKSIKTALLQNHLVINYPVPYVINYNDIQWVYLEKRRTLLFFKKFQLVIYDQNFKCTKVLYASGFVKKKMIDADKLVDCLDSVNPTVIVGYTHKNRQLFYQRKHQIKQK